MANIGIQFRSDNERQIADILTRCHDWLANHLEIDSQLEFGRTAIFGRDAFHCGLWLNHSKQSVINYRNLYGNNVNLILDVVAHEARHAVQYKTGMLSEKGRERDSKHDGRWEIGYWQNKLYSGAYKNAPWEIDARSYEPIYKQLIIDAGIVSAEELALKLAYPPGENKAEIFLEKETRDAIKQQYGDVSFYKAAVLTREQYEVNRTAANLLVEQTDWKKLDRKQCQKFKKQIDNLRRFPYRKDAVAFLTIEEERNLPKSERFYAAQANVVEYAKREITRDDWVF